MSTPSAAAPLCVVTTWLEVADSWSSAAEAAVLETASRKSAASDKGGTPRAEATPSAPSTSASHSEQRAAARVLLGALGGGNCWSPSTWPSSANRARSRCSSGARALPRAFKENGRGRSGLVLATALRAVARSVFGRGPGSWSRAVICFV